MSEIIIMGVDPSFNNSGLAVISGREGLYRYVDGYCVSTNSKMLLEDRLSIIYDKTCEVLRKYAPTLMATESCFMHLCSDTAIKLGMVHGVIRLAARVNKVAMREYSPRYIRKTVAGKGSLTKQGMDHWMKILLKNFNDTDNEHIVDAAAAALCGAREMH